jgi:hypothetical protein
MKKILSVFILIITLTFFVACNVKIENKQEYRSIIDWTTKSEKVGESAYYIHYEIPKQGTMKDTIETNQKEVKLTFKNISGKADIYIYDKKGNKLYEKIDAQADECILNNTEGKEITFEIKGTEHEGEFKINW